MPQKTGATTAKSGTLTAEIEGIVAKNDVIATENATNTKAKNDSITAASDAKTPTYLIWSMC